MVLKLHIQTYLYNSTFGIGHSPALNLKNTFEHFRGNIFEFHVPSWSRHFPCTVSRPIPSYPIPTHLFSCIPYLSCICPLEICISPHVKVLLRKLRWFRTCIKKTCEKLKNLRWGDDPSPFEWTPPLPSLTLHYLARSLRKSPYFYL